MFHSSSNTPYSRAQQLRCVSGDVRGRAISPALEARLSVTGTCELPCAFRLGTELRVGFALRDTAAKLFQPFDSSEARMRGFAISYKDLIIG